METWRIEDEAELGAVVVAVQVIAKPKDNGATVLALHGDLGVGKTTFTQTLARALGVTEPVTSPTFVIMKGYALEDQAFSKLVHIDAYRIESPNELSVLGFASLVETPQTLVIIEWAEKVAALLPQGTHHLTFTLEGTVRTIMLS